MNLRKDHYSAKQTKEESWSLTGLGEFFSKGTIVLQKVPFKKFSVSSWDASQIENFLRSAKIHFFAFQEKGDSQGSPDSKL